METAASQSPTASVHSMARCWNGGRAATPAAELARSNTNRQRKPVTPPETSRADSEKGAATLPHFGRQWLFEVHRSLQCLRWFFRGNPFKNNFHGAVPFQIIARRHVAIQAHQPLPAPVACLRATSEASDSGGQPAQQGCSRRLRPREMKFVTWQIFTSVAHVKRHVDHGPT